MIGQAGLSCRVFAVAAAVVPAAVIAEEVVEELPRVVLIKAAVSAVVVIIAVSRILLRPPGDRLLGRRVKGELYGCLRAVAVDREGHGAARGIALLRRGQVAQGGNGLVVDLRNDVSRAESGLRRRAAVLNGVDVDALRDVNAVLLGEARCQAAGADADVGLVGHASVLHDVGEHRDDVVDRNREAETLDRGSGIGGVLRRNDADHLAVGVKERAARVAGVDRGGGLDHVKRRSVDVDRAVGAGDDALAHRERQLAKRVADGGDGLADPELGRVADRDRLKAGLLDLDDGDIIVLVAAYDARVIGLGVVERHLDGARALDDVVVRDDVAVGRDNKAAAARRVLHGLVERVGRNRRVDRNDAVDVRLIDLGQRELLAAGDLDRFDLGRLAVAHLNGGRAALAVRAAERGADDRGRARADHAADQRAHEHQRDNLDAEAVLFPRCLRGFRRLLRVVAGIVYGFDDVRVALAVAIMIEIVFVLVIHKSFLLVSSPAADAVMYFVSYPLKACLALL